MSFCSPYTPYVEWSTINIDDYEQFTPLGKEESTSTPAKSFSVPSVDPDTTINYSDNSDRVLKATIASFVQSCQTESNSIESEHVMDKIVRTRTGPDTRRQGCAIWQRQVCLVKAGSCALSLVRDLDPVVARTEVKTSLGIFLISKLRRLLLWPQLVVISPNHMLLGSHKSRGSESGRRTVRHFLLQVNNLRFQMKINFKKEWK